MSGGPNINLERLIGRIEALGRIGALDGGGLGRLALTDADKQGRDLVAGWMTDLGLEVTIDAIGNIFGLRRGHEDGAPVMTGSHIDTVPGGGKYDGALGVLAGLEVIETLRDAGIETRHPLAVGIFTNEEGNRFHPDMMGSLVHAGGLDLDEALDARDPDGLRLGDELRRIGYAGAGPIGAIVPRAYVELHVEQGPVLESEGLTIGAVEGVQGMSWTEFRIAGEANHAGTTPMGLRRDAGYAAASIAHFARGIADSLGGDQVATAGRLELSPGQINVIPGSALLTIDLRNTDDEILCRAEALLADYVAELAGREQVAIDSRSLARFAPVDFDDKIISLVEQSARELGFPVRRMPSGAGHDAQMMARICPTAMIFVPSQAGISHNRAEFTAAPDLEAGATVLLRVLLELAR